MRLMDAERTLGGPVNLGNPREFTIHELAEEIIAITGSRSKIVRCPLPAYDSRLRQPNITRARMELGRAPQVAPA